MYILHLIIASFALMVVLHQAWGRLESRFLWGGIYYSIALLLCLIPHTVLAIAALVGFKILIVGCMGPWKRSTIWIIDRKGRDPEKLKQDFTNIVGKADTEDLRVIDVSKALMDPICIKNYTDIAQQEEIWSDLQMLKDNKVRYVVKNGIITSLFVDACEAKIACDLLGITVEVIQEPSAN